MFARCLAAILPLAVAAASAEVPSGERLFGLPAAALQEAAISSEEEDRVPDRPEDQEASAPTALEFTPVEFPEGVNPVDWVRGEAPSTPAQGVPDAEGHTALEMEPVTFPAGVNPMEWVRGEITDEALGAGEHTALEMEPVELPEGVDPMEWLRGEAPEAAAETAPPSGGQTSLEMTPMQVPEGVDPMEWLRGEVPGEAVEQTPLVRRFGPAPERRSAIGLEEALAVVANDDIDAVRAYFDANPEAADAMYGAEDVRPVHVAAGYGRLETVELLAGMGVNLNARNQRGQAPLHYAAALWREDVMEFLLDAGAPPEARDHTGRSTLDYAESAGFQAGVARLAPYFERDPLESMTTIESAAAGAAERVAQMIARNAAFVETRDDEERGPLHHAVLNGHLEVAAVLLENGADVDRADENYVRPLHLAAIHGDPALVELLLEYGATVNARTRNGMSSLSYAAENGHAEAAALLLRHGANQTGNVNRTTPLHFAVAYNYTDVVRLLLDDGADIYAPNRRNITPKEMTIRLDRPEALRAMLELRPNLELTPDERVRLMRLGHVDLARDIAVAQYGERPTAALGPEAPGARRVAPTPRRELAAAREVSGGEQGEEPRTRELPSNLPDDPMAWAFTRGDLELVRAVLREVPGTAAAPMQSGTYPMHLAAGFGDTELMALLAESGAAPDAYNAKGQTPLHYAAAAGREEAVNWLLEAQVSRFTRDHSDKTPYAYAEAAGVADGLDVLYVPEAPRASGPQSREAWLFQAMDDGRRDEIWELTEIYDDLVTLRDDDGRTLLHVAIDQGDQEFAHYLLEHGAPVDAADDDGRRPIHYAAKKGWTDFVKRLLADGADVGPDNRMVTPLHYAAGVRDEDMVLALVEAGADFRVENERGHKPIDYAAWLDDQEFVRFMVRSGSAGPNHQLLLRRARAQAEDRRRQQAREAMEAGEDPGEGETPGLAERLFAF